MLADLVHEWKNYYAKKERKIYQVMCESEFKVFLRGLELGALYSNNMKYYEAVMKIIDSLNLDEGEEE